MTSCARFCTSVTREFSKACCAFSTSSVVRLPTMASRSTPSRAISIGADRLARAGGRGLCRGQRLPRLDRILHRGAARIVHQLRRLLRALPRLAHRGILGAALIDRHGELHHRLVAVGLRTPQQSRCSIWNI